MTGNQETEENIWKLILEPPTEFRGNGVNVSLMGYCEGTEIIHTKHLCSEVSVRIIIFRAWPPCHLTRISVLVLLEFWLSVNAESLSLPPLGLWCRLFTPQMYLLRRQVDAKIESRYLLSVLVVYGTLHSESKVLSLICTEHILTWSYPLLGSIPRAAITSDHEL